MFKNIKSMKSKIISGYILIIVILFLVTMWTIINFTGLSDSITNIMVENYNSIKACESLIESIERQDSAILMILNAQEEKGRNTFRKNEKDFYKLLSGVKDRSSIDGEESTIKSIKDNYVKYLNYYDTFQGIKDNDKRRNYYNEELLPVFLQIKNKIRDLRGINQNQMLNAHKKANLRADHAMISTIIISAIAIIIAILFSFYLSKQILKPINKLKKAVNEISKRNFKYKLQMKSSNEIGDLIKQFNHLIDRLQDYEKLNVKKLLDEKNKFEAIINNINSPLMVLDNENKIIMINQKARKLFNIQHYDENKHFLEVINNNKLFDKIKKSKEKKELDEKSVEIKINEKQKHYKVNTNNIIDENKEIKYLVILLEDITELKQIDQMKSEFVSMVTHEFMTPLTSMNMGLEMIFNEEVGKINDQQQELLKAALEDTNRLNELVDNLLDLSKIESGKIQMSFDKVNVKKLINKNLKSFKKKAKEKGLEMKVDNISEDLYIYADPSKISWVVSNLLDNALRYTDKGFVEISAEKIGYRIYIYVKDSGIGIPVEYQDKIFDKFIRADNTGEVKGTGLGLTIVKEIVKAHEGSIWVESKEGEGSKFVFHVPMYKEKENKKGEILA